MKYIVYNYRKSILALLVLCAMSVSLSAQQLRTSYFMDKSTVRLSLNPAFRPDRGFVGIPVIGSMQVSLGSNGLAVSDLLYPRNGKLVTFLDESVSSEAFLKKLKKNNQLNVDFATSILSGGWYSGTGFWTVDLTIKGLSSARIPKNLFEFMKQGSGPEGATYDISNLDMYADSYLEAGVGYSRPITDKLTVGGKVKFLLGAANMDASFDKMNIVMSDQQWHITSLGRMNVSMKGLSATMEKDNKNKDYINSFDFDTPGIAGLGAAIDLGATYQLTDNLTLSAAVLDLGFISWGKSSAIAGVADGEFKFDGFNLPIGSAATPGGSVSDQFDDLTDDITNLFHFREQAGNGRTTMVRSTINLGAEYSILENRLGFGLLSSTRFYRPMVYTELTASANYRPFNWVAASLSYSFIHSDFKTFGFALNFSPSWFNFFIGTDYMITRTTPQMLPINAHAANFYLGLSVPLHKRD